VGTGRTARKNTTCRVELDSRGTEGVAELERKYQLPIKKTLSKVTAGSIYHLYVQGHGSEGKMGYRRREEILKKEGFMLIKIEESWAWQSS